MRVPKPHPYKLLRSVEKRSRVFIQASDLARMRAVQDFLSKDESDDRRRGGTQRDWCRETQNETVGGHIVVPGRFRLPRFPADVRAPCGGDRLCGKRLTCSYPTPHL